MVRPIQAAAAVVQIQVDNAERSLLYLLLSLADKNLLGSVTGPDGGPRFRVLETIRHYACERLDARAEMPALRQRHASYYLSLAEADKAPLRGLAQRRQWERVEIEYDNLRAALGWSLGGGDAEMGVRLATALGNFWNRRGYLSEGREWLASALAQHSVTTDVRAEALMGAAVLASTQGDYSAARAQLEASMLLFRELERWSGVAEAWFDAAGFVADPTEREEHERNVAVARVQLDEETFNAAWAEGRALTLDQAAAEALGHDERGIS